MSTRRAVAYSFVDRYAGLVIHVAASMVIARLLTPGEVGVYSIAMVLIGFIATFRDLGAGQYVVQKKDLDTDDLRAAWTVQLGLGLLLATVILAASLLVADFYAEPRLRDIMFVLAVNFAITPFGALPYAWLTREIRFGALAVVRFAGSSAHALVAISLAWIGLGPISLAWANLASTVVGIVLAVIVVGMRLPWAPRLSGIGKVVSFGGQVSAVSLLSVVKDSSPELFLGKLQGMVDTGLFSRARGLVAMFERLVMDAANAVALPYFAREAREGGALAPPFLRVFAVITGLGWSLLACIGILAFPVTRVLYGDQWDAAVDPMRWLAAAMALSIPVHVSLAPLLAAGAVSPLVRVAAWSAALTIAAAAFGAWLGLSPLCLLLVPAAAASAALWLRLGQRHIGFAWTALGRLAGQSALVAAGAAAVPLAISLVVGWRSTSILPVLLIAIPGSGLGFLLMALLTRHVLWEEFARSLRALRA